MKERETKETYMLFCIYNLFPNQLCLKIGNMPIGCPEDDTYRGITGQQYSNVDASNKGDEIPTDPQDLNLFVQRVLEQMVRRM